MSPTGSPILRFAALTVCTVFSAGPIIAYERPLRVDVALVLAADVSSSMAETDALLTLRAGFVAAFAESQFAGGA
jgi:hypothetical protein